MHIAGFNIRKIVVKHFSHRRAGHIGALLGQPAVGKVAACMLRVSHIHVADNIHNATVGLFRQTLVFAAVAGFHVEDGDVQTLGAYHRKARVGVAQHEHTVGL